MLWEETERWQGTKCDVMNDIDTGSYGLGMDDLRNYQGMVAAHADRLQGLAISASRKVNVKVVAMHYIRCCC